MTKVTNTRENAIQRLTNSFEVGQMFDSDKMKLMITSLDEKSIVLTVLDGTIRQQKTRTLVGKNGESIKQKVVSNKPKLTDKIRRYSKQTFAALILNKNFEPTRLARYEKFHDLQGLEINRFLVKQTLPLR